VAITASEARKNLFRLIEQVNDDRRPIEVTSKRGGRGPALTRRLRCPGRGRLPAAGSANTRRLLESLAQARSDEREAHDLE